MKKEKCNLGVCIMIIIIVILSVVTFFSISTLISINQDLHYNYGIIKEVDGIWYKTTYFCFEDDSQSISVYYGSDLFDYAIENIKTGDSVVVVWKYVTTEAETFSGDINVPWLVRLVEGGEVVFP